MGLKTERTLGFHYVVLKHSNIKKALQLSAIQYFSINFVQTKNTYKWE